MKSFWIITTFLLLTSSLLAQEDLMGMLEEDEEEKVEFETALFKAPRIMLGQSIENPPKGAMVFVIAHHFGRLNSGWYEFWGIDQANIRFVFDYGITDWLSVGVGRTSVEKTYDGSVKVKLLRQSTGLRKMPLSVSYYGNVAVNTLKWSDPERENFFSSRLSYFNQLLIARKISPSVTLQVSPTYVHRNLVPTNEDENDVFAVGAGGRFKIDYRFSINAEYYYLLPGKTADDFHDSFTVGFDLETGGHVFQIYLTNSLGLLEQQFVANTTGDWFKGDIHIGFNINRTFQIVKPKLPE